MGKEFKILSIDGGGMKGVFSAKVLEHLEKVIIENDPNGRLVDYFDMICGTSTGGIIALALSQRTPASEIVSFYEKYGKTIFPPTSKISKMFKRMFWGWQYENKPLREALTKLFKNRTIKESECLLCIPAYSLTKGQPFIFKYDHHDGIKINEGKLDRDNKFTYVDVALSTSAAPAYLPIFTLEAYHDYQMIDGGVYANNPTLIGLTEALHYFVGDDKEFESLSILSIASLNENAAEKPNLRKKQTVLSWPSQLIRATMSGQSFTVHFAVEQICKSSLLKFSYERIPSGHIARDQSNHIQLDASSDVSIKLMRGKGDDQGLEFVKKPGVLKFFKEKKHYIIKERYPNG